MDSRKIVFKETGIVALGVFICVGITYAVYALLGYFDLTVLWDGLVGAVLAVANFFFMAANAVTAADKAVQQDVNGGKKLMKFSYILRLGVIFVVLAACVKSGFCNALASVLPLLFVRPVLTVSGFFRKKEV